METTVLCEHLIQPWKNSPIGLALLIEFINDGQLTPVPCKLCPPTPTENGKD